MGDVAASLGLRDPGPLARFQAVVADASTMSVLVQRLTDGETLKQVARAWQIPYGKLAEWIIEDRDRSEAYSRALEIWADSLAQEAIAIADEQAEVVKRDGTTFDPEVPRDKLRIDTRLKLAGKWNRQRYGESTEVKHTGSVSLISVLSSLPRTGRVIEAEAVPSIENVPIEKISEKPAAPELI